MAACRILNGWSGTLDSVTGSADRYLAAGIYGCELANTAEIMRDHPSFELEPMKELLLNVFYPMNDDFLKNHNTAHIGNYWANWDLCNIASMMSIGIFCDREDIYNQALDYYKTGLGNGSIYNAMPYVFEDGTVQWQEAGRDQGHTTFGISLCEVICEMAWNQGDDLYGLSDNRLLKAAEYVAKYNSGEDVQYAPYEWLKGQTGTSEWKNGISEAGRGSVRPVYSMIYNHYVNRKGLSAPTIEKLLHPSEGIYIEGAQSNGDEFGWQTLTFANISERAADKGIQGDFADGTYRICSVMTGKALVVDQQGNLASAETGTKDEEWWIVKNKGDGEYTITNSVTGKAMQVNDAYYSYGSRIGTADATGGLNQNFAFVKNDSGDYRIIPTINYLVLALEADRTEDETAIIQWRYHTGAGQRWTLEKAASEDEDSSVDAGQAAGQTGTGNNNVTVPSNKESSSVTNAGSEGMQAFFTANYPLLIEHIIREAKLYRDTLRKLMGGKRIHCKNMLRQEEFWNQIMMEHVLFIRGLLDPSEEELIEAADGFSKDYKKLLEAMQDCHGSEKTAEQSLEETINLREFKTAGTKGILECEIESLILPLLAGHVLREANHYIRILEGENGCSCGE